jgi:broad specificity phosphatase PhoE
LKEKYVASGQHRDKLSENAQSLRIKTDSLEVLNKEAVAEATQSRKALDEFKSGIDKASSELQSALATTKALLEEERRKNTLLSQQASFQNLSLATASF